jgi:hypothetical protein
VYCLINIDHHFDADPDGTVRLRPVRKVSGLHGVNQSWQPCDSRSFDVVPTVQSPVATRDTAPPRPRTAQSSTQLCSVLIGCANWKRTHHPNPLYSAPTLV